MLTTFRGKLNTSRGTPSSPAPDNSGVVTFHFKARQAEVQAQGAYRLALEPAPAAILQVDYDGLLLYEGQRPGFTWDGAGFMDLELTGGMYTGEADVHIRAST